VAITRGENRKLALTIHGQELLKLGHLSSSLVAHLLSGTVTVFYFGE
jgi:hypothetical protein